MNEFLEYSEANRRYTEALRETANYRIELDPQFTTTGHFPDESATVEDMVFTDTTGLETTQSIQEIAAIDDEHAAEIARIRNESLLTSASILVSSAQLMVSMYHDVEKMRSTSVDSDTEDEARLLGFKRADIVISEAFGPKNETVKLTRIQLEGVEHYETVVQHLIDINDAEVHKNLSLVTINDMAPFISKQMEPQKDLLRERTFQLLEPSDAYTLLTLATAPDTEVAFNELAAEVYAKQEGTAQEHEIGPLLEEIDIRRRAYQDSQALTAQFPGLDNPTQEEFQDIQYILDHLA